MINFLFGLFVGIVTGIISAFVAFVVSMVIVEDSPNILEAINENLNKKE